MAKRKNIKGLPNSLVQRYFSTLFWWDKVYMADWICNASSEKQITSLEIDILNQTVFPTDLQIKPIVGHLPKLKETIEKTLESNGFQNNYITTAKFKINFRNNSFKHLYCTAILTDQEGELLESSEYCEPAYEDSFKVFDNSIIGKIKDILK